MNSDKKNNSENKKLCIFDLDGTLIKFFPLDTKVEIDPKHIIKIYQLGIIVIKRPGFEILMDFVFENYDVGFWAAEEEYFTEAILIFCLKREYHEKIKFIWSQKQCRKIKYLKDERHDIYYYFNKRPITKPLCKLWKKAFARGKWNNKNTLIIEDTVENCVENYGNAIYLNNFNIENYDIDQTLSYLKDYLIKMLDVNDYRKIDKRNWLNITKNNNNIFIEKNI